MEEIESWNVRRHRAMFGVVILERLAMSESYLIVCQGRPDAPCGKLVAAICPCGTRHEVQRTAQWSPRRCMVRFYAGMARIDQSA